MLVSKIDLQSFTLTCDKCNRQVANLNLGTQNPFSVNMEKNLATFEEMMISWHAPECDKLTNKN